MDLAVDQAHTTAVSFRSPIDLTSHHGFASTITMLAKAAVPHMVHGAGQAIERPPVAPRVFDFLPSQASKLARSWSKMRPGSKANERPTRNYHIPNES